MNTDVLKEQVSAANEPIVAASRFVKGIWIWIGIEVGIIVTGFCCICANAILEEHRRNFSENCEYLCDDFAGFVKLYKVLN